MTDRRELPMLPDFAGGTSFTATRRVRWGDGDRVRRLRLDAAARYLQDVANDDTRAVGPASSEAWIARRTIIVVHEPAQVGELLSLTTFCGGLGSRWADRRTSIVGDGGGHLECSGLWIRFDPATGRPARLDDAFLALYADFTGDRKVPARLHHDPVAPGATHRPWPLRSTDLDGLDHVNNAATWEAVEDELARRGILPNWCELEHREAIAPEDEVTLSSCLDPDGALLLWLTVAGAVRASAVVHARP